MEDQNSRKSRHVSNGFNRFTCRFACTQVDIKGSGVFTIAGTSCGREKARPIVQGRSGVVIACILIHAAGAAGIVTTTHTAFIFCESARPVILYRIGVKIARSGIGASKVLATGSHVYACSEAASVGSNGRCQGFTDDGWMEFEVHRSTGYGVAITHHGPNLRLRVVGARPFSLVTIVYGPRRPSAPMGVV